MTTQNPNTLKGLMLMAMPALADPNFFQTVTCLCEHNEQGALGLIINRVHPNLTAHDIFRELKLEHVDAMAQVPLHIGGPVHIDEVFILHGAPFGWQGCLQISPTLAMSNTMDILQAVALGKGPESFLITLGCAGWADGQLEAEIKENAWLTGPANEEIIFRKNIEERWDAALRDVGVNPALLSNAAGHA